MLIKFGMVFVMRFVIVMFVSGMGVIVFLLWRIFGLIVFFYFFVGIILIISVMSCVIWLSVCLIILNVRGIVRYVSMINIV